MDDKAERLKAALRENLKRRKAQVRARAGADRKPDAEPAPPRDRTSDPER